MGTVQLTGLLVVVAVLRLVVPPHADAQSVTTVQAARALAVDGHHVEAVSMLRDQLVSSPNDNDARVLLATVLSWDKEYDEARTLLEAALAAHPSDGDALHALVNVELWSDRPRRALDAAARGLREAPNDGAFLDGRRRALVAIDAQRPWEVSESVTGDWFNDGRDAWQEWTASLKHTAPLGSIAVSGSRVRRFALTDNAFNVEGYPRLYKGAYAYLAVGVTPHPVLYPRYRYVGDVYQSLGAGFEASVGYRRLGFTHSTGIYVGSLSKYVGDWLMTGRMDHIPDRLAGASRSYHGSLRRYLGGGGTSFAGVRYSRGFTREEIRSTTDLEVLDSHTVAGELQLSLGSRARLTLSGGWSLQDRVGQSRLRQFSFTVGSGVRL